MVAPGTVVYALGTVAMLVGVAVVVQLLGDDALDAGAGRFRLLLVIPAFAALSYGAMAAGIGQFSVGEYTVDAMRYVDWFVTTPVLVAYVGHVVDVDRRWLVGAAGADAVMIAAGWVATTTTGVTRWTGFAVSCVAFLALLYVLFRVFPRKAQTNTPERRRLFFRLRNQIGILWMLYPVIWLASPVGFGLVSTLGTAMLVTFMDVAAKVPYTWVVYEHRGIFGRTDAAATGAEGENGDVRPVGDDGPAPVAD